ncbi:MAG: hypothetical protein U0229_10295 [Anaeromyxobacter sp.]
MASRWPWVALAGALVAAAQGCDEDEPPKYRIGGTVIGLTGKLLVLSTEGRPPVSLDAGATHFTFDGEVRDGTRYDVKVQDQPTVGTCTVSQGKGTVSGADVTVSVTCQGTSGWTSAGPLKHARGYLPASATLESGKVLVAGGHTDPTDPGWFSEITNSAEVFDPSVGGWSPTGSMTVPRRSACGVRLASGKVLVAGGWREGPPGVFTSERTAELYDPVGGTWTRTGDMTATRPITTCVLLDSGEVLVTGLADEQEAKGSVDLFDPATGTFARTGAYAHPRWNPTLTKLANGKVLAAGGRLDVAPFDETATAELYDPQSGTWSPAGALPAGVLCAAAVLLPSGKVLVTGGCSNDSTCGAGQVGSPSGLDAERWARLYDPATNGWSDAGTMAVGRTGHALLPLPSGRVLAAGGGFRAGTRRASELYDPATNTWSPAPSSPSMHVFGFAARLNDGRWLVAGGLGEHAFRQGSQDNVLEDTEIFEE